MEEIEEMKYIDIDELAEDMILFPDKYAAWFLTAFPIVYKYILMKIRKKEVSDLGKDER